MTTRTIDREAAVGEPDAWDADTAVESLYAAHWRPLVRLGVLLVRDQGTAEEVAQDAFAAARPWSTAPNRPATPSRRP